MLVLIGLCGGAGGAADPPKGKKTAKAGEISLLRERLERAEKKADRYKKELVQAKATIERMQYEKTTLEREVLTEAAEELRSFAQWLSNAIAGEGLTVSQQRSLLGVLEAGLGEWSEGQTRRRTLVEGAMGYLEKRVGDLERALAAERRKRQRNLTVADVERSAMAVCELLEGKSGAARAGLIKDMIGRRVKWTGKIVDLVDRRTAPYQVEVRCGELVAFLDLVNKRKRTKAHRWVKVGMEVEVKGKIVDVGDTLQSCGSVLLSKSTLKRKRE